MNSRHQVSRRRLRIDLAPTKFLILALFLAAFVCSACRKIPSKPEADVSWDISGTNVNRISLTATSPMKEAAGAINAHVEEFISSVTNAMPTNDPAARARVAAYLETNLPAASANSFPELGSATDFLVQSKRAGQLPGLPKDRLVHAASDSLPPESLNRYPLRVIFHIVMEDDVLTNHYTLLRSFPNAAWKLEKAWRTDVQGRTIVQWPIE